MAAVVAHHEFDDAGWRWIYELHPDKLVLVGLRSEEEQHYEMDLKHALPAPDRWLEAYDFRFPRRLVVTTIAVMLFTALLGVAVYGLTLRFDIGPWGRQNVSVVPIFSGALLVIEFVIAFSLPRWLGIRHFRRCVRFRRASDGGELLRFSSKVNPTGKAFEEFVGQISAAIAAAHRPTRTEPPPSDAFEAGR